MNRKQAIRLAIKLMKHHRRMYHAVGVSAPVEFIFAQRDREKAKEINQAIAILEDLIKLEGDGP
jgi:hypothetical protein